jgi:hypothetical protein
MKGIIFSVCVMMVGVFSWGKMVVAAPGPFYNVGKNAAEQSAESAWDNLGRNCKNIQTFAQIVGDSVHDAARDTETRYRGRSAKDFGAGYQDGLFSVLNRVRDECGDENAILEKLRLSLNKLFPDQDDASIPDKTPSDGPRPPRPYHQSYYRIAYNAASGLARTTWDNLGWDCTKTSKFVEIVGYGMDDAIAEIGTRYTGWAAEEFGRGYIEGLMDVLNQVINICVNECSPLGNAMGEWSAKLFCQVATAIEKAPKFTGRIAHIRGKKCGNAYGSECESGFVGIAKDSCPEYTSSDSFKDYYSPGNEGCCSYHSY